MAEEKIIGYPFKAKEDLIAQGKVLAKSYGISFNLALTMMLKWAVEEWAIHGMERREPPGVSEELQKDAT